MNHTRRVSLATLKKSQESKHIHDDIPVRVISKTMQKTLLRGCIGILQRTPFACGNCEGRTLRRCAGIFPAHGICSVQVPVNFDARCILTLPYARPQGALDTVGQSLTRVDAPTGADPQLAHDAPANKKDHACIHCANLSRVVSVA